MNRPLRLLALFLLPFLAACGGSPEAPPPPSDVGGVEEPATTSESASLRIAMSREISTLDPHLHDEASSYSLLGNVYEGLVGLDADMQVVPALAESWENVDDVTWRFTLREGVTFHDGSPLEAEDVRASMNRATNHPRSKVSGYLVSVKSVAAVDPRTIELVTHGPSPVLLRKLVSVQVVARDAPDEITEPVGTGPYRFVAYSRGSHVDLASHADHWREAPAFPTVRFSFVTDARARVEKLLAGDVDVVQEVGVQDLPKVMFANGQEVKTRAGIKVTYLNLLVTGEPFSDPKVRRALDLAIDRGALVESMRAGEGLPAGQMVSPEIYGHDPDLPAPRRDLAAAKELLEEAGYADGLDLDLEFREGMQPKPLIDQLAEAGIRVRARAQPWAELYPRLIAGEVPLYLGSWGCESGDASSLFDHKAHSKDPEAGYGSSNSMGYANETLDGLIEESGRTLDEAKRADLLRRGMRILDEDLPMIPLFVPSAIYASNSDLEWTPRLDGTVHAAEIRPASGS